jgi:hypothetical protein
LPSMIMATCWGTLSSGIWLVISAIIFSFQGRGITLP